MNMDVIKSFTEQMQGFAAPLTRYNQLLASNIEQLTRLQLASANAYAELGLNQLQAAAIAAQGIQPVRGPLRDALTVFDENAAFLVAPPPLWDALEARDWWRLFVELRPLWADAQLVLFGHALLEKLVYARKPVVAHIYRAQVAINSVVNVDATIAADLCANRLAAKPFIPMPVLGVPGWWAPNTDFSFYDDPSVFRPRRTA